jgi:uncharacterized flavoprotein (TIGR03862 family)
MPDLMGPNNGGRVLSAGGWKVDVVSSVLPCTVAVVGGGPAGLMAAETLSAAGVAVHVFDAMPSVGRKFLLAGIGGLNLTHAEPLPAFVARYGDQAAACGRWLDAMSPTTVREWAAGLGIETFVGTSQRVFPTDMKAAPLLRAWLHRLRHPASGAPVTFHMRHRWNGGLERDVGTKTYRMDFDTPQGLVQVRAGAVLLALGGGSWPKLGSDGAWQAWLTAQGVPLERLRPANCGFDVAVHGRPGWSEHVATRFAGQPLKPVVLRFTDAEGRVFERKGECVVTATGIEGSLVYAASAGLRDQIECVGQASLTLDLKPDLSHERVLAEVVRPRGGKTLSNHLKNRLGLGALHMALLHEVLDKTGRQDATRLTAAIKALPLTLVAPRPMEEAISTAGGVRLDALTDGLMLRDHAGLFCAGEMLDWEAPTGGYLLTACLASGRVAGQGMLAFLRGAGHAG